MQRRFLPPSGWLTAFEAVERHGSVTAAAQELDLTQGAVSRQIQKLEELLGVALFVRAKKRLVATPTAQRYADEIRSALSQISNATISVQTNPRGGTLELAILPAFGTHWLAPRLPEFLSNNPGVTLNLSTRTLPFDFSNERFHAAVHFGKDDWNGTEALKLMDEELVPAVSPRLVGHIEELTPQDFLDCPLLHLKTRQYAWPRWLSVQGLEADKPGGMGFDQFAAMKQAALAGVGAALLPRYLVQDEIENGDLMTVKTAEKMEDGAYYLVWPKTEGRYPPLEALREWMELRFV